jgi:hypothetical protein
LAFGFDAPAARAPQALLAVVPPGPETTWSPEGRDLVDVVLDTRALARVRMALPTQPELAELASLLPTALVPQNGPAGVSVSLPEGEE